jgi:hypothetical protein
MAPPTAPDPTEARLAALEREAAEQRGARRLAVGALLIVAASAVTGVVSMVRTMERVDTLTHQLEAHEHPATAQALGDLRADLRVLSTQLEQIRATTSEIRSQVARVEDATLRPPAAPPLPRR